MEKIFSRREVCIQLCVRSKLKSIMLDNLKELLEKVTIKSYNRITVNNNASNGGSL